MGNATRLARPAAALQLTLPELLLEQGAALPRSEADPVNQGEGNAAITRGLVTKVVNHGNLADADQVLAPSYTIHGPSFAQDDRRR